MLNKFKKILSGFLIFSLIFSIFLFSRKDSKGIKSIKEDKDYEKLAKEVIKDFNLDVVEKHSASSLNENIVIKDFNPNEIREHDDCLMKSKNPNGKNITMANAVNMSFNDKGELLFLEINEDIHIKLIEKNADIKKFDENKIRTVIKKVEEKYIKDDYVKLSEGEPYQGVVMVSYGKKLENDGVDRYNGANFILNKANGEILNFTKLDRNIVDREVKLSKKDALEIFLKQNPEYRGENLDVKLKTSYYIKKTTEDITEIPELVYSINLKDKTVFLNPETGELLGYDFPICKKEN